jgi:hypothetical protein
MLSPHNYCSKAIEQFAAGGNPAMPISAAAIGYIRAKLIHAEKFILPDGGRLLPSDRAKPEVPGLIFRPPFPVVALEYQMDSASTWDDGSIYTASSAPKRIALAWDWQDDFPPRMRTPATSMLGPGVMLMEISWRAEICQWIPGLAALHIGYDDEWTKVEALPPFMAAMVERGQVKPHLAAVGRLAFPHSMVPMLTEAVFHKAQVAGSWEAAVDLIRADTNDELIAYIDLCYALACKNVATERFPAPDKLNRARIKAGKMPLFDHHVLMLNGAQGEAGSADHGVRNGPRSHLRRGHIRRLGVERITWVNQTMVRGSGGFVDKTYAVRAMAV